MHVLESELRLPIRSLLLGLGILVAAVVAGTGGYLIKTASVTPISVAPASISAPVAIPTRTDLSDQRAASEKSAPAVEVPAASQPAEVAEPVSVASAPADDQPEPGDVPDGE